VRGAKIDQLLLDPTWGPFLRTRKSVESKRRAAKIYHTLMQSITPRGCEYVSRQEIERSLDESELISIASSNLDRLLKDMEEQGLVEKIKVRDNDQKTGNPERTYFRLNSLIFSPNYQGNDLKTHFKELYSESESLSVYVKEMLIFIKEKGLMDEWTARQTNQMEKNLVEKCRENPEKLDKAFMAMLKSTILQFEIYKRRFSKRNIEEITLLVTSGHYTEFIARVESKCGKRKVVRKK